MFLQYKNVGVRKWSQTGVFTQFLKLNASKTVILTTEAQPPDHITTPAGHTIVVKDSFGTHKWLGCMLSGIGSGNADADITYHLQAAARAFHG